MLGIPPLNDGGRRRDSGYWADVFVAEPGVFHKAVGQRMVGLRPQTNALGAAIIGNTRQIARTCAQSNAQ